MAGFDFDLDNGGYGMPYYRPRSMRTPNALGFIEPNAGGLQDTWGDVMFNYHGGVRGAASRKAGSSFLPAYDSSNLFTTLRNVKNPEIDAAAQNILGQISSLSTNPDAQRDTVVRSTKSPELQSRLGDEYRNYDTDRTTNRGSLADFTSSFLAADPQAKEQTDQEIGSIGEFYNGGVRRDLDALSDARRTGVTAAASDAAGRVQRASRLGQLMRGGNDSYLGAQLADSTGDILTKAAIDDAEQRKGNYVYQREGANRMIGQRGNLLNNYLTRRMVPTQAGQQMNAADLQRLFGIGAAENANNFYRTTNAQQLLAEKLGLLSGVSGLDLANTFYGLKKPYEPNVQGYVSDRGGFNGGGFEFSPAAASFNGGQPNIRSSRGAPQSSGVVPQFSVPNTEFDMGAGSAASRGGLPGTMVTGADGSTWVRRADGTLDQVGADGLTSQQRWYNDDAADIQERGQYPSNYINATVPSFQGYDTLNLDLFGRAA